MWPIVSFTRERILLSFTTVVFWGFLGLLVFLSDSSLDIILRVNGNRFQMQRPHLKSTLDLLSVYVEVKE